MRRSLSRQLALHVLAIVLVVGALFSALSWGVWEYQNRAAEKQLGQSQQAAMREQLELLFQSWQDDAETLAASLTFQRMLEAPGAARWQKLRAFMTSLGETYPYSGLVVVDASQRVVLALGEEAGEFPPGAPAPRLADWYRGEDHRQLHRLMRAPLWLGLDGGHGELWLLRPLDNLTLRRLAPAGAAVHLTVDDRVYASSQGNAPVGLRTRYPRIDLHRSDAGNLCADIPLAGAAERLHIELSRNKAPAWQFALAGLALSLTLLATLYLALGRWTHRTLDRVRALGRAAVAFGAGHRIDPQVDAALGLAGGKRDDELDALQLALRELMQGAEARDAEAHAYLKTLDMLEEAVIEVDRDGRILRASPALARLTGKEHPQNLVECFHPDDREALEQQFADLFSGAKSFVNLRLRIVREALGEDWIECRFMPADQPATRVRGVLRDITQAYLHARQVTHMALHDALTGLPNRVLLEDRCEVAIRLAQRQTGHKVGLAFIDLDHFKQVNDSHGHKTGDQLLKAFAGRLRQSLREGDTLARWGGDEFVILLPNLHDLASLREVAGKISSGCREPLRIEDSEYAVTFSMGAAVYPDDADNVDTLLSQADRAMFYAKAQGRNNVQFFLDMGKKGLGKKDLYIQNRLTTAIREGRIQTFFQPIVEAGSRRIVAFEALARWHDNELGWVSPASFIPMAENLGLVRELGDQVWQEALRQMSRHKLRGLRMSVNLSTRQLFMPGLGAKLLDDVSRHGLAPGDFILEVTESVALREVDYAAERLKELADAGFHIALDDFGTGYSSLSQLHTMPVGELKIDIAFVQRIHEPAGREIIEAIVHIAHAHNLVTVAEGVEDEATAVALERIGVHQMQGYLFAKPMPAGEMDALLIG
jgi:diguanylate cyclase (GGDEF)-like protein